MADKALVSLKTCLIAKDGRQYSAVYGTFHGQGHDDTSYKIGKSLFVEISNIAAVEWTDIEPPITVTDSHVNQDGKLCEYTRPSYIYIAE